MSSLTAFVSPASPFARKVRVTILEAGLADRVTLRNVATTALNSDPELVAANPLGRIPALLRGDGPLVCDSPVICRYLDSLAGTNLYPAERIWEVLSLEALVDGLLDSAVLMVYEHKLRPGEMVFAPWVEAQWQKVDRTLSEIETGWAEAMAQPLDGAQIALGCALGYLDFRHGDRDWRAGRPALAAWYETFAARPSMQATVPA
ncbi:glutathione S-transferase family protein [Pseudooceanicola sp. CBS1P-1]|uniref:Glutathione S-transferase n=1 Tax=Pseudooceanicola albus TaxID=2692189 RepID=A0A6L7G966_9RHOB|nr:MULTISPECIES: glutathione S-transferase family protein [Pseudooceanicola]MBT9385896.1 glutathione S-transferase family protein [Pseudooceanicola endophyticus]MXN20127.1 glutathione S-transferase [Pseudooceanicola albus]